jgi:biotin carboxyl carrier protein
MKVVRLPRGGLCVFTGAGERLVVTRDAVGRLWVDHAGGRTVVAAAGDVPTARSAPGGGDDPVVRAPAGGRLVAVLVEVGAEVAAGDPLAVVELMKTELRVGAPRAGRVVAVHARPGTAVERGAPLVTLA